MSKTYIQIGTYNDNSQDHHREITINGANINPADLVRAFMAEDVEEVTPAEEQTTTAEIAPFKFIHPSITDEREQRQITLEIQNLARNLPLPEVCRYMRQMYREKRVYLNVKIESMFDELHRLGLPDENTPGYTFKNFKNYFNMND